MFLLWASRAPLYAAVFELAGIKQFTAPFLDLFGMLSWGDCLREGYDVYVDNPCDPLGRLATYSPLLLDLPMHWIGRRNIVAAGTVVDLAFLVMLALVARPDSRRTLAIWLLIALSSTILFGLERANLDLFVFALIGFATLLGTRSQAWRRLAYAVYAIGGLIKFYPFALLGLVTRERRRVAVAYGITAAAIITVFAVHYWTDLLKVRALLPRTDYFGDMFGATILPSALARVLHLPTFGRALLFGALYAVAGLLVYRWTKTLRSTAPSIDWNAPDFAFLITGSVLTVACFFAGASAGYRAAMLVFIIPAILALRQSATDASARRLMSFALYGTLFCLWEEFFRHNVERLGRLTGSLSATVIAFLVAREFLWWGVVSVLLTFVVLFVLQTPFVRSLRRPRSVEAEVAGA
jgi:hypothetical protein